MNDQTRVIYIIKRKEKLGRNKCSLKKNFGYNHDAIMLLTQWFFRRLNFLSGCGRDGFYH